MADPNTRQGKRTPVTLKIKFKSETLEQFIERYAVDVSQGGIFIRTKEPLAVGTQMKFEFQLRDASPLIAGEGTVVWTRENDPSRPAIAPGMGVRFDKLADGSQNILEKILAEKAKQAPSRSNNVTAPGDKGGGAGGGFTDVPTRVAPAPVQEALGLRSRTDSEHTPLPKPMPFHSDADDFDEKAFDEATKVRSLEDLAAASAALDGQHDDGSGLDDNPKHATTLMPADQLDSHRRVSAEREAVAFHDSTPPTKAVPDRESAPALPSAPAVESASAQKSGPRMLDATPSPASEPPAENVGSTKLGMEPAKAVTAPASTPAPSPAADTAAPRSVAKEPSRPTAPSRPSSAPIVIGIIAALAIAGGAVWFFVLRDKGAKQIADQPKPTPGSAVDNGSGSQMAGGSSTEPSGSNATGSAGSAVANAGSGAGSAGTMAGSNAGSAATPAAAVDTVITATGAKGATIEIVGTDQKGPSPFTAKLEKDKAYTARVTAPGYLANELSVKGGQKSTASLTIKPHVVTINTDPPGADVFIDGTNTDRMTPTDVQLTAAQAAKPRVRVTLRRPGYRQVDQMVDAASYKESDAKATTSITVKLQQQQQVVRPPNNGGGAGSGAAGSGGGGGSGTGDSGTGGGETGSASAPPPPPPPPPAPTPAPAAGSAAPSGGQTLK